MAIEALRLLLAKHNLVQMGTRQQLVVRLETHTNDSPSGGVTVTDILPYTNTLPQEELAQIISSSIDEKPTAQQDGSQQHNQLVPTPHMGFFSTVPSPPMPSVTQDGSQQQQQSVATLPPASPAFNPLDPANVAALHPDFRQLLLASHLMKTTTTAIMNGDCVDFATLFPISSLLEEARNSQLRLHIGAQGG